MTDALRERLQQALGTSHTIERELGGGRSRVFVATEHDGNGALRLEIMPEFAFVECFPPFDTLSRRVGVL